jgi:predicted transcriptional regulator
MRQPLSSNPTSVQPPRPSQRIRIRLPLATVEELDHLARLTHTSRQHILRRIINAGLVTDQPLQPDGPDAEQRLHWHGRLTEARSLELADRSAEA